MREHYGTPVLFYDIAQLSAEGTGSAPERALLLALCLGRRGSNDCVLLDRATARPTPPALTSPSPPLDAAAAAAAVDRRAALGLGRIRSLELECTDAIRCLS